MPSKEQLEQYAEILVRIGLNVQPDQPVSIQSPLETADFARIVMEKAYEAGAANVDMEWNDPLSRRIRLEREKEEFLVRVPRWPIDRIKESADANMAFLNIYSENPDLLSHIDPARVHKYHKAMGEAFKEVQKNFMDDRVTWLVCSLPTQDWAQKMFPDLSSQDAVDKLWDVIFTTMRMNEPDPVAAWKAHLDNLENRAQWLNGLKLAKLHYQGPGTDLTVELPELHTWVAATSVNAAGTPFVANLPTEEVYTLPHRDGINGVVSSTMPLAYGGVVIEGIQLKFENGRVVDFSSKTGYETLKGLIETDEGSRSLGEIALVPVDSPISKLNTLFYNTLFDENASCHMALGMAYPTCLEGGRDMSRAKLDELGVNDSVVHEDFMVGSSQLNIDGILRDGSKVPVFRNGNWAQS